MRRFFPVLPWCLFYLFVIFNVVLHVCTVWVFVEYMKTGDARSGYAGGVPTVAQPRPPRPRVKLFCSLSRDILEKNTCRYSRMDTIVR